MTIERRPHGQPIEVSAAYWPEHRQTETTRLFRELMLRLERTPERKAIVIPFDDKKSAYRARKNVGQMMRARLRNGWAEFAIGDYNGSPALWVRRGPNWGNGNGVIAEETEDE